MRRSEKYEALEELYSRVPKMIGCDRRCWVSCGPVEMSATERQRIRERGVKIMPVQQAVMQREVHWCEALTEGHRCSVYEIRPLICRIWGAVEKMACPYGCVPEGGWIPDKVAVEMIAEAERIGGAGLPPARTTFNIKPESAGIELRMQYNLPPALRKPERVFPCPLCGFTLTAPLGCTDEPIGECAHCHSVVKVPR